MWFGRRRKTSHALSKPMKDDDAARSKHRVPCHIIPFALMTSINDLPTELLWTIFVECGHSEPLSFSNELPTALAVSLVSRLWYQSALQVPELWTTISSRLSKASVLLWLERSRGLSVRILLDLPENPLSTGFCVKHVLEPCIERVTLLSIRGVYHNRVIDTLRRRVQDALPFQLQTLHLHPLGKDASREARNRAYVVELRDIPLQRLFISSGVRLNPTTLRRIRVDDLEIGPGDETVRMQTPLALILSSLFGATTIRTLRLDVSGAYDARLPHVIRETINCTHLERIYLAGDMRFCKTLLDRLRCPPLHACGLSFTWTTKTPDMDALHVTLVRALSARIARRPRSMIVRIYPPRVVFLAFDESLRWDSHDRTLLDSIPATASGTVFAIEMHCPPEHTSARAAEELLDELIAHEMLWALEELIVISPNQSDLLPHHIFDDLKFIPTLIAHCRSDMVNLNGFHSNDPMWLEPEDNPQWEQAPPNPASPAMVLIARNATGSTTKFEVVPQLFAERIGGMVDAMDIRVALWGRRRGEPLPVW
ncbi:unnamed protein product [Peniophora sp. CBMAI 1063]|nr:unnamed protein product [Peniophora sp. CBMAI 1063]